jgi:hypothetical protein
MATSNLGIAAPIKPISHDAGSGFLVQAGKPAPLAIGAEQTDFADRAAGALTGGTVARSVG